MINIIHPKIEAPERWFTFPESPDEQYRLRYIPPHSIPPCKDVDGNNDPLAFNEHAWQRAVVAWKGVNGENDAPIPCNDETRLLFLRDRSGMAEKRMKWVFGIVFNENNFSETDGVLKNLPAPSPGASTSPRPPLAAA